MASGLGGARGSPLTEPDNGNGAEIAREVLRESIRSRCAQTLPAALTVGVLIVTQAVLLLGQVSVARLLGWFVPLASVMAVRVALAKRILPGLDAAAAAALARSDRWLRASSIANQFVAGTGMWIIALGAREHIAFFATLAIALFAVGATLFQRRYA